MKYKTTHSILLLVLSISIFGCNGDANSNAKTETNKKPKIALIMKSLANDFFSTMEDGAVAHQKENSDQYELITNGIKDERDLSRQSALVDEMVASGVNAIVIAPADSKALVPALRRAKKVGVVVINIDNRLDAEILKKEGVQIPFVGPNNKEGAKTVAAYLARKLKEGSEVAVLEGIQTSFNGTQRRLGFEEAMKEGNLKIVTSQTAQWETSQANVISTSILTKHENLKAILAANDNMALGAIAAIKALGKSEDILVVGFDNIAAVQSAIKDGKILATVDQHGDKLAVFGIEYALRLLENPDAKVDDLETPVDLITKEDLK